jgi:Flp pilus assembly protein TadD
MVFAGLSAAPAWPQSADELFRQGSRLFAEGKPDPAIAAFQASVRLQPGFAPAWKALGVALASRGDYDAAETPFRNACERLPALPDACLYYGRTLYLLNRFRPAIQVLRGAIPNERNPTEAYRLLALSFEGLGEVAEAESAFRQALRNNRGGLPDEDPGIDYGVFLYRQGRAEQSLGPLEDVLKRHPETARAHLELGCILLSLDRLPDAAAHLERAVAVDARNARAHLLLGKTYLRLGKPDLAEEHLRQGSRTVK